MGPAADKPPAAALACCGVSVALGIFVPYCMAIHFTLNRPCCQDFIMAMIAVIAISFLDKCVEMCKSFRMVAVRCVLKAAIVASQIATIHQPF